jgi:glycosyltransferase involved in cell wall biosynthesis
MNSEPKISVLMITYNHARFIRQALDSVFAQRTNFSYEVVIGDDASTDGTGAILAEYAEKFPDRVRLLLRQKNIGMNPNLADTLAACRGEYIALLEGDDYWTDPDKLNRQVEFLDGHPECVNCFHNVVVVSDDPAVPVQGYHLHPDGRRLLCALDLKPRYAQVDFLRGNYIPTCSVMFRRTAAGTLPPWFKKLQLGDHPLHVLCTEHGLAAYLPGVMAAYRLHAGGVWSSNTSLHRAARGLEMYEELCRHYHGRPQAATLQKWRLHALQGTARQLKKNGYWSEAAAMFATYLKLSLERPAYCLSDLRRVMRAAFLLLSLKIALLTRRQTKPLFYKK